MSCAAYNYLSSVSIWRTTCESPLASAAIERRASGLDDALDNAIATGSRTPLALAVVGAKLVLEGAEFAGGLAVITQGGASLVDGIDQHRLDRIDQHAGAIVRRPGSRCDRAGPSVGRDAGTMQRFAGIDVTQAGNDSLVRQGGFQRCFPAPACARQNCGVKADA